jgi:hypothetical protein
MFILLQWDNTLQIRFKLFLSFIILILNFLRKGMYVYTVQGILTSLDFLTKKKHDKILRYFNKSVSLFFYILTIAFNQLFNLLYSFNHKVIHYIGRRPH